MVVEAKRPLQRGKFRGFTGFPWCSAVDRFGFVEDVGPILPISHLLWAVSFRVAGQLSRKRPFTTGRNGSVSARRSLPGRRRTRDDRYRLGKDSRLDKSTVPSVPPSGFLRQSASVDKHVTRAQSPAAQNAFANRTIAQVSRSQ